MEVATFVQNINQFYGPNSGMCVAYVAAQIIRMSPPDQSNPSAVSDIDRLAEQLYTAMTGQIVEPLPVSVEALKEVLSGFGIQFRDIGTDTASIDAALASGCPVIAQGHESGFRYASDNSSPSPYRWDTNPYNHAIILTGIQSDTGYFVRDSANSSDGPVVYSKSMALFSAIQIIPNWIGGSMFIYNPGQGDFNNYFAAIDNDHWKCKKNDAVLQFGNLAFYRSLSIDGQSVPLPGLPLENEQPYHEEDGYYWSTQRCERGTIVYDPEHRKGAQPGCGASYLAHFDYDAMNKLAAAQAEIATLQSMINADPVVASARAYVEALDKLRADIQG